MRLGAIGLVWLAIAEGLSIGARGWNWSLLESLFGETSGQLAFGAARWCAGAGLHLDDLVRGGGTRRAKGDAFVLSSIALLILLVTTFVLYPVLSIFYRRFQSFDGSFTTEGVARNIADPKIWSLSCLIGGADCGVAWRTLFLAVCTATAATALGLAFALVATRTQFPS